jgi:hypothetical protein
MIFSTKKEFNLSNPQAAKIVACVLAIIYAAIVSMLPSDNFRDRDNYMAYLEYSAARIDGWRSMSTIEVLVNEPIWLLINACLGGLLEHEYAIKIVIFVPAFIVAFLILKVDPKNIILLISLLILPQVAKNHVVHLRQGMGLGIFLLGWFGRSTSQKWLFWFVAPLIHSSFFFVILEILLVQLIRLVKVSEVFGLIMFSGIGLSVSLAANIIARVYGARQSEYLETTVVEGISGFGFFLWAFMLLVMVRQGVGFLKNHLLECGSIVVYLTTYFTSPISARIFESTIILVLIAGLKLGKPNKILFYVSIVTFGSLQWVSFYQKGVSPFIIE